jgi:hypothetical protein
MAFSILNVIAYFIHLILLYNLFPRIYSYVNATADIADQNGDPITALALRLIPFAIVAVTISIPFRWAKTYVRGEEEFV